MGFLGSKLYVYRLRSKLSSGHMGRLQPTGSSAIHHQHRHRGRRFHRPRQALGFGYESYEAVPRSSPLPLTPIFSSPPPPLPVSELLAPKREREIVSVEEEARKPALNGMRMCAWILWLVLLCLNFKRIIAVFWLAFRAWPNIN
jgi:hypothetical protein